MLTDEEKDKLYKTKGITLPAGMSAFGPSLSEWMQMSGLGTMFHNFVNPSAEQELTVVEKTISNRDKNYNPGSNNPKRKFLFNVKISKN